MTGFALACLDMAGTTVADDGLVERAFAAAAAELGIAAPSPTYQDMIAVVRETMGQSKIEVFRRLFGDEERARQANAAFERSFLGSVQAGAVTALPGAGSTIATLRRAGVQVALTTGFAQSTQDAIVAALGWRDAVDLLACPGPGVRGRPYPDLIRHAAAALGVTDPGAVVVVGDTPSDIASGVAARAGLVFGVLTGAGDREGLLGAGATGVLNSIGQLPPVLGL
jgi:phosphonatase-like hydrolase